MKHRLISLMLTTLILGSVHTNANELQSLKNMERERAQLIAMFVDADIATDARHIKVQARQNRLVDLERLVMRDDRLLGHKHRLVRRTFSDYDLSFLVHASAESKQQPIEHWLSEMGLDTGSVLHTHVGRR